jgi:hypothetical protein
VQIRPGCRPVPLTSVCAYSVSARIGLRRFPLWSTVVGSKRGSGLFVPKPSPGVIVVRTPGADLLVLSVNVWQRAWTAGGIVTQLVTHSRPETPTACLQGCPLPVKPGLCGYVRTCVLGFRHGGTASALVESLLPGVLRERARVGTGQDHRGLDAVRLSSALAAQTAGPAGHVTVYCATPHCRSVWYKPRHEPGQEP